jgi:hypothetical protein
MTWSSANNSVNSCLFFESGVPVITSLYHLVIISSKHILNGVGERGKPWRTSQLISARFDDLELSFIDILFCLCMSTITFNNVSGGRAMAQAVSRWPLTAEARGSRPGQSMWDLWWTKWHWAGFLRVLRFPLQKYHSTIAPYSSITAP